jgi:hypothetical protein
MNNSLILSTLNSVLPSLSAKGLTYIDIAKMFLTPLWISRAGNAYQQGLRFSDRIAITYCIGHGYIYTFLNGIRIFKYEDNKLVLINERYFSCCVWNDEFVNRATVNLLAETLESNLKTLGINYYNTNEIRQIATTFVDNTIKATSLIGNESLKQLT